MSRKAKGRRANPPPPHPLTSSPPHPISSEPGHAGRRRRLRVFLLGAATLAVLALGWFLWGWATAPAPPAVSLAGADPAVARAIEAARRAVWWKPRSAAAWGRLGQLLRAHGAVPESNRCFAQAERLDPGDPRWPYLQGTGLQSDDPE